MKKMILMLMAMVVFGNVYSSTLTWIELDVKSVFVSPDASEAFQVIFMDVNWDNNTSTSHYYCLDASTSNGSVDYKKVVLSTLLSAKANGNKVKIQITGTSTVQGDERKYFQRVLVVE